MSLLNLPLELLLMIYKNFDLIKLANVAVTHPNNYAAAEILYREKYGKLRITISGYQMNFVYFHITATNTIGLYDFDFTLTVLKLFGHLIPSLLIDYEAYTDKQRKQIDQHINEYCAKTLNYFEIGYCRGNEFANLPGPFTNVENVRFKFGVINSENIRFDKIFPNVRRLDLGSVLYTDSNCFEHNFTHLEYLDISRFHTGAHSKLAKTLEMNSHVPSILIYQCSLEFLKIVSEKVPNLKNLEISHFQHFSDYKGEDIHLHHLKNFTFLYPDQFERIPLVLRSLENFYYIGSIDSWFDIIIQSKHIKKLTIGLLSNEQLMRIANELEELEEITTAYRSGNLTEEVLEFIKTGKSLKKVLFSATGYETQKTVEQRLGSEWQATVQMGRYVFVKKC